MTACAIFLLGLTLGLHGFRVQRALERIAVALESHR